MNTYTMLSVHDQAAAVELLPPIQSSGKPEKEHLEARATGTDGPGVVLSVVPCGAQNGAQRLSSKQTQVASNCTEAVIQKGDFKIAEPQLTSEETSTNGTSLHESALTRSEVPEEGLEPSRPKGHWILNPARLPIPPLWLSL